MRYKENTELITARSLIFVIEVKSSTRLEIQASGNAGREAMVG